MPGFMPGIQRLWNFGQERRGWLGHRRAKATPFFERLCPAMTEQHGVSIKAQTAPGIARRFAPKPYGRSNLR
jgi:hypothetical protein